MKKLRIGILALMLLLVMTACGGKKNVAEGGNPTPVTQATEETVVPVDFETQLRRDAFPEEDALMSAVGDAVEYVQLTDQGAKVTFTVRAPDFSEELIGWYNEQPQVTEQQLQEKILALLKGEKRDTPVTLEYTIGDDGTVHFRYTEEYLNAAGCGLRQFYTHMYEAVLGQMGGQSDG